MDASYSYQDSLHLLNDSEWSKLSIQNRTSVMQSVENEVARREGRTPCNVSLFSEPPKDGRIIAGQYNRENRNIEINDYHLRGKSSDCLDTILHEGRHAYQNQAVSSEINHYNKAEVDAWRNNMKPGHYIQPEENRRAYYRQPIEADAREYAAIVSGQVISEQKIQQYSNNKGINSYIEKSAASHKSTESLNKGIQDFRSRASQPDEGSASNAIRAAQSTDPGQSTGSGQGR